MILKRVVPKTWEVKLFNIGVIGTLKTAQLLRPKEPSAEAPAEAIIPMLSGCDDGGSDKGSDEGSNKGDGLDGDTSDDDGDDNPGFNFLPDEEEDDNNDDSEGNVSLPPPLSKCDLLPIRVMMRTKTPWMQ
jgi:hypothetical protein